MRFSRAIVRPPTPSLVQGLTTANLGLPDYAKALEQHQQYTAVLRECGLEVQELPALEAFPDSTFIEDVALCTPACTIITRPGAPSRQGETAGLRAVLETYYDYLEEIEAPGTLEAGDVMMVDDHYFIGLSARTNPEGARQLIAILEAYGLSGSTISLTEVLHLKTGLSYLENDHLLVSGEFVDHPDFSNFHCIGVDADEAYAANSLWINNRVLVPAGFPKTKTRIEAAGYETVEIDVSEFRKLDGGLSCLSLRF